MSYKSFYPGAVTYAEILNQLNTFTNDGGNVFERAMVVSNLRTFFQNAITNSTKNDHSGLIKVEFLRCRKDGTSYIGFGKNDTLVECSKDPAAIGTAVIARHAPNNKPFYGMNFIVSPDLSKKIFGDEDITMLVKFVKEEDTGDEKPDKDDKEKNQSPATDPVQNESKTDSEKNEETKTETTEPELTSIPNTPMSAIQDPTIESPKAGMIPMSPVKPGKHGNKK